MTNNGQAYGPIKFKQIIKECYVIAKNVNTSYVELLDITPAEKTELLKLIIEENQKTQEALNKVKNNQKGNSGGDRRFR